MKSSLKLSADDIKTKRENALELFYSGIEAEQTKQAMVRSLSFLTYASTMFTALSWLSRAISTNCWALSLVALKQISTYFNQEKSQASYHA